MVRLAIESACGSDCSCSERVSRQKGQGGSSCCRCCLPKAHDGRRRCFQGCPPERPCSLGRGQSRHTLTLRFLAYFAAQMDDDDDFGDVVDFGDGAKYTLQVREQSKAPSPEPEQQQPIISSSTSAPALELAAPTNSRPPVNEFDRGRGTAEGRSLFNDRLGKLEPYSKEQQHKSSHRKVLAPPRPSSSGEAALAEVRQPGRRPSASSHVPFQREPHTAPHASAPQQAAPPLTENRPVDRSAAQRPSPQARQAPLPPTTTNKPAWGTLPPAVQPLDLSRAPDASSNRATSPSHHEQVAASSASIKPPPPMPFARSPEKETAPLPKPDPSSPSISKDDLESYHSEMQSAAERARKRRQEEEDARQAEAERHKLERLKALDERLKANQSPEPPSSTTEKHPVLPATADPPAPSPSLAHRPHKTSSSATAPAKAISPTIPSPQTAVSDATTPNRSDSGPWRAAPAKRTPLPPQEVAAEAALKDLKRETGHRAQKAPQSPHDPPAVDDRTERSWRRSAPVAPSAILQRQKPDKSLSRQTPLTDPPKSPQSSDKKQDVPSSPSMVQSMWPVEALESASSTAAESFDFQTNEVPMRQPRSSEPPSSPDPSAKPSSPATDSPQTHSKVPSAEAEEHSKSVPQVRLSAADAKSPTGHLKQNHKPAISSSSFDDALARIKGVMQASAAQHAASSAGLRPQPETERRNRFDTPHRDSSFHRRLSAEEVTAIERDLATTRRERSVSPRRAWRAIPRMKIPAQSSKVVGPPISMRQLKLFKRGPIQVRPSSVAPAYESARAELFHRRGPFTVKLKPSPKINAVEARPLRDPRPGNAFDSGPWRRGATLRRDEPATEAGDLVATSRDVFDDGLGTPTKPTPSITVVLPTPSAKSSAKIANPAVLPSFPEVGAQVTQPPPG